MNTQHTLRDIRLGTFPEDVCAILMVLNEPIPEKKQPCDFLGQEGRAKLTLRKSQSLGPLGRQSCVEMGRGNEAASTDEVSSERTREDLPATSPPPDIGFLQLHSKHINQLKRAGLEDRVPQRK